MSMTMDDLEMCPPGYAGTAKCNGMCGDCASEYLKRLENESDEAGDSRQAGEGEAVKCYVADKQVIARKAYACSRCGGRIRPGDKYIRRTYQFYDGENRDYFKGVFCEKCAKKERSIEATSQDS